MVWFVRNQGLESLLGKDDELVQEVKRLDSDMQVGPCVHDVYMIETPNPDSTRFRRVCIFFWYIYTRVDQPMEHQPTIP